MTDTVVKPPQQVISWFMQNMPAGADKIGFIHENLTYVLMLYGVSAPYQGGFGAYELWLRANLPDKPLISYQAPLIKTSSPLTDSIPSKINPTTTFILIVVVVVIGYMVLHG